MLMQNVNLCVLVLFPSIFGINGQPPRYYLKFDSNSLLQSDKGYEVIYANYEIESIDDSLADMGEGPHWDYNTQNLYYVDINAGKILRYSYNEKKVYKAKVEGEKFASFIIPVDGTNNNFVVGCGLRVRIVQWDGISEQAKPIRTLFEVQMYDERYEGNRFNDGKCDSYGRLFAGTMRYKGDVYEHRWGELYKYEKGGKIEPVKTDVGISNGLAWNDKTKKFYFADTADFDVKAYDYNIKTGKVDVSKPEVILDLHRANNKHIQPDGLTIDTEGNVYVATFNGSSIYKVNPVTHQTLLKIDMPCLHVTSMAFGGPTSDILFVTTATEGGLGWPCGSVFKISGLGAQGHKMNNIKI